MFYLLSNAFYTNFLLGCYKRYFLKTFAQ